VVTVEAPRFFAWHLPWGFFFLKTTEVEMTVKTLERARHELKKELEEA